MEFSQLKKNLKKDFSSFPVLKVALLADSASQFFNQSLRGYGYTQGINLEIWEADYDQIYQTIIDEHSFLYSQSPDFIIIYQSSQKLISDFYKKKLSEKQSFAKTHKHFLEQLTNLINSRLNANIIFINYPEINDSIFGNYTNKTTASFLYQLRLMNLNLMELAINVKNVNICDLSTIQNFIGRSTLSSDKMYITADSVLSLDALPVIAKNINDIIQAYQGKFKKCLILDLDNTLWGGIIGDDGVEGIQIGDLGIGKAFSKFQQWIKQLKERGIILAVCSKNTEHIAKEPFEKHPDMELRLEDIAVFVANWNNKADNIRHIQSILNIGFDSMVFLDDNPFERGIVKKEIPEITVPDLPEDPAEYLSFLYQQNLFETTSFTEEDTKRNDQYREEAERAVLLQTFTNEADYLQSLEMKAEIQPVNKFSLPRAAQLTQRSNQFNLRTIRYTEEQMHAIITDPNKFTLSVSLKDKFGEYGLISLIILHKTSKDQLFIDTWIMSCRVLKRNVEEFVLNKMVNLAAINGCQSLRGEYLPTQKNGLVKDHYKNLGFTNIDGYWQLPVNEYKIKHTHIQN